MKQPENISNTNFECLRIHIPGASNGPPNRFLRFALTQVPRTRLSSSLARSTFVGLFCRPSRWVTRAVACGLPLFHAADFLPSPSQQTPNPKSGRENYMPVQYKTAKAGLARVG